jgi:cyclophilin family peptidyl-prolyl cis-trans isomerase
LKIILPFLAIGLLLSCLPLKAAYTPTNDGLYVQFTVEHNSTNYEFTAELYYEEVPLTVAHFVDLVEGNKTWADFSAGVLKSTPFYNGLTFHRIISGFVIQGGSPNGKGTDGPGIVIPDDMDPGFSHSGAGFLSMANSGPNTNGSQFFVTLGAATGLDGKHTIFGNVIDGLSDVQSIGNVPVVDEKPVNPVTITSATIIRVGPAATNFTSGGADTPEPLAFRPLTIDIPSASVYSIKVPNRDASRNYIIAGAPSLGGSWRTVYYSRAHPSQSSTFALDVSSIPNGTPQSEPEPVFFFTALESESVTRKDGTGESFSFVFPELSNGTPIEVTFTSETEGTYTFGSTSGNLDFYDLYDLGNRCQLYFKMDAFVTTIQLYFDDSLSSGTVFGQFTNSETDFFNLNGTFSSP